MTTTTEQNRLIELNEQAEKIFRNHPEDYHRRADFKTIVNERSKLLWKGGEK